MDYLALFKKRPSPLCVAWNEKIKDWVYKLVPSTTSSSQPIQESPLPALAPFIEDQIIEAEFAYAQAERTLADAKYTLAQAKHALAQRKSSELSTLLLTTAKSVFARAQFLSQAVEDTFFTNVLAIGDTISPELYATFTKWCIVTINTPTLSPEIREKALKYVQLLAIQHHHLPALQYLAAYYYHGLATGNTQSLTERDYQEAIKLIETVLALLPTLPFHEDSQILLLNTANIISFLHKLPDSPLAKDYAELSYARCMYHANQLLGRKDLRYESWQICHDLFKQDPSNSLAGLYSIIIPLLARKLPTNIPANTSVLDLYEYLDTAIKQLQKTINPSAAQTVIDIFYAELKQSAYYGNDRIRLRALRLLHLTAQAVGQTGEAKQYKHDLEITRKALAPKFRDDIVLSKIYALRLSIDCSATAIAQYLNLVQETNAALQKFHPEDRIQAKHYLLNDFINNVIPCMPVLIYNHEMQILTRVFECIKQDFKSDPQVVDALIEQFILLINNKDTALDRIESTLAPLLEKYFPKKQYMNTQLFYAYLLLNSLAKQICTQNTENEYIAACTLLYTMITELPLQDLGIQLKPHAQYLITETSKLLYKACQAEEYNYTFTNRLLLFDYLIKFGHPTAHLDKAHCIQKTVDSFNHTLPLDQARKLVQESIHIFKKDDTISSRLTLYQLYEKGLDFGMNTNLIPKDLKHASTYATRARQDLVTYSRNFLAQNRDLSVIEAYAHRGILYAMEEKYQEAYTDLSHYLTSRQILTAKPENNLDSEALFLFALCDYILNGENLDRLITHWLLALQNKEINTQCINIHLLKCQKIRERLIITSRDHIARKPLERQTFDVCNLLLLLGQYEIANIYFFDQESAFNYLIHHNQLNTSSLIALFNDSADKKPLHIRAAYLLYHRSEELSEYNLTQNTIKKYLEKLTYKGSLLASWYYLCIHAIENPSEQTLVSFLNQFFSKPTTRDMLLQETSDNMKELLEDINNSTLLPILKKMSDNFCLEERMPDSESNAVYITYYYARLLYKIFTSAMFDADKKYEYFTNAVRLLMKLEQQTNPAIIQFKAQEALEMLSHTLSYSLIAEIDNAQETVQNIVKQAVLERNACAFFKLAFINFHGLDAGPRTIKKNISSAHNFFLQGLIVEQNTPKDSYEYYAIQLLKRKCKKFAEILNITLELPNSNSDKKTS